MELAADRKPGAKRLSELEREWNEKFIQAPKLPTSALLTGALSMALAFGAVLFLLSASMRGYAWIWIALSIATGLVNRLLARRWYRVVVAWDTERKEAARVLEAERQKAF